MNGPFKGVSAALWFHRHRGGHEDPSVSRENNRKMLAVVVIGAVALSLFIEVVLFFLTPDEP
ncbi:hypothetical protein QTA58_20765 [Neorhizobium sp. CSC1952]|uniref:hypothetical protein n=1 Tax=Rhizobium/Agrobacterium group TaxID=227290 RepID=UPI00117A78DE|nr:MULTISPECIES: hypothetical protein [Rhizobium/Agrobacterium group]WJR66612.1 hypothetical protein QTA58_20765 [Rhizobium sp. CSC1952]